MIEAASQLQEATQPFGWLTVVYLLTMLLTLLVILIEASRGGIPPRV